MANLVNKNFTEIAADGHNYLLWAIMLKNAKGFIDDINKPNTQAQFQTQPNILLLETSYSRISQDIGKGST